MRWSWVHVPLVPAPLFVTPSVLLALLGFIASIFETNDIHSALHLCSFRFHAYFPIHILLAGNHQEACWQ